MKWYDHENDMTALSIKYPHVTFTLEGCGEEMPDLWKKYFLGGQMQRADAEITYPPCTLTPPPTKAVEDARRKRLRAKLDAHFTPVTNPDEDLTALAIDFTFVARGYYITPVASLTATLVSGVATIGGSAVASLPAAHTYTAQRDTYIDLAGDGTVAYSEVYLNAAAPAQTDGTLRLGFVRTDASAITDFVRLCSYSETFRTTYQIAP